MNYGLQEIQEDFWGKYIVTFQLYGINGNHYIPYFKGKYINKKNI